MPRLSEGGEGDYRRRLASNRQVIRRLISGSRGTGPPGFCGGRARRAAAGGAMACACGRVALFLILLEAVEAAGPFRRPSRAWCPLRRPDPQQLLKVKPGTLSRYRAMIARFTAWYQGAGHVWEELEELDALLVLWKNHSPKPISRSMFANTVAGVELILPFARRRLLWSRAVLEGWAVSSPIVHTFPLSWPVALIIAAAMCRRGLRRMARGLLLQLLRGWRPGELLHLVAGDIILPEEAGVHAGGVAVVHLGARAGTKCKRPEADVVQPSEVLVMKLLRDLKAGLEKNASLFAGFTLARYRTLLATICLLLGLLGYRPHSPRAGYATARHLKGDPFSAIMEGGRWRAPSSLRTYLDAVAVLQQLTVGDGARWMSAALLVENNLDRVLVGDISVFAELDVANPRVAAVVPKIS